jgi:hypothetical protein
MNTDKTFCFHRRLSAFIGGPIILHTLSARVYVEIVAERKENITKPFNAECKGYSWNQGSRRSTPIGKILRHTRPSAISPSGHRRPPLEC